MSSIAAIIYFICCETWSPCYRGKQALGIILAFNIFLILPLADEAAASRKQMSRRITALSSSLPFLQPPNWLHQSSHAARVLLRINCITLPRAFLLANLSTLYECLPPIVRPILKLVILMLKVLLLATVALPLQLMTLALTFTGVMVAYCALYMLRISAWVSLAIVIISAHFMTRTIVMFYDWYRCLERCAAKLFAKIVTVMKPSQRYIDQQPTSPLPTLSPPSLYSVKSVRAFVLNMRHLHDEASSSAKTTAYLCFTNRIFANDNLYLETVDFSALLIFSISTDLVASAASLIVQILNEVAQARQNGLGALNHLVAVITSFVTETETQDSGANGEVAILNDEVKVLVRGSSARYLIRHVTSLILFLRCVYCIRKMVILISSPTECITEKLAATERGASIPSNDIHKRGVDKKQRNRRRRKVLTDSDEEDAMD